MKYAIIAAGEGSRLAQEGVILPKPLVEINGEPLIDRLLRVFMSNEAEEIVVICNNHSPKVVDHLSKIQQYGLQGMSVPLHYIVKTTRSSMHSLYELSTWLSGDMFCATTVDTVFLEEEFAQYVQTLKICVATGVCDGVMGVTSFVDDERPLYVEVDHNRRICGFHDKKETCSFVSAGIYGLTPNALTLLKKCVDEGMRRMRNFQREMVAQGMNLRAYPFSKVLDIDHLADIAKAEKFLKRR